MPLAFLTLFLSFADPPQPTQTTVPGEVTSPDDPSGLAVRVQCACLPSDEWLSPDREGEFALYRAPAGTYRFTLLNDDQRLLDATAVVVVPGETPSFVWLDSRGGEFRRQRLAQFRARRSPTRSAVSPTIEKVEAMRAVRGVEPPRQSPQETIGLVLLGTGAAALTPAVFSFALGADWVTAVALGVPGVALAAIGTTTYAIGRRQRMMRLRLSAASVHGQF